MRYHAGRPPTGYRSIATEGKLTLWAPGDLAIAGDPVAALLTHPQGHPPVDLTIESMELYDALIVVARVAAENASDEGPVIGTHTVLRFSAEFDSADQARAIAAVLTEAEEQVRVLDARPKLHAIRDSGNRVVILWDDETGNRVPLHDGTRWWTVEGARRLAR